MKNTDMVFPGLADRTSFIPVSEKFKKDLAHNVAQALAHRRQARRASRNSMGSGAFSA